MATKLTQTTVVGQGKFTIGENTDLTIFDGQVLSITLEPSVQKGEKREVLSGATVPGNRSESWTIKGKLLDDFGTPKSLVEYCFTNRGKQKPFKFTPATKSGKELSGTLEIEAVAIGGDVGKTAEPDFEFAIIGAPTLGALVG